MMKKTKIVCTLGPSTDSDEVLDALLTNGMNVARFNFSHGTHEDHKKRIAAVRAASIRTCTPVAILLDTKGPEIRVGHFINKKVSLSKGQVFILTGREVQGDEKIVSISHVTLANDINVGQNILLADGLVQLEVTAIDGVDIVTEVKNSGEISDRKRVAVPGIRLNLPPLSEQDKADILFGLQEDIDFIAASFIQRASDVLQIKELLNKESKSSVQVIAKIENAEGINNIEKILTVADGFMIARGDLGVEIPSEDVPMLQKRMIKMCNRVGKSVITATQMLESMIQNPRPTRAEASDVANAILDGTDAVMLSGETASGAYPIEAVKTMTSIAKRIESELACGHEQISLELERNNVTDAIGHAVVQMSQEVDIKGIITATESGFTAQMISRYRPKVPIFAVTPHEKIIRRLQLTWGVIAIKGTAEKDTDAMTYGAINRCLEEKLIQKGDLVEVTAGIPIGKIGSTNMIQIHKAGEIYPH